MSPETYRKKCVSTLKEFVSILDVNEVKLCLKEYGQVENSGFVKATVNFVLESKKSEAKQRQSCAKLISELVGSTITNDDVVKGLRIALTTFDENCIDFPFAKTFLSEFFAQLVVLKVADLSTLLKQIHETSVSSGNAEKIVGKTLYALKSSSMGVSGVVSLLKDKHGSTCRSLFRNKSTTLKSFLEDFNDSLVDVSKAL
tara:strand:+ start:400 stop:999 length:600 start_codon:yes stop_codon:yes gene_type:complete